MQAEAWHTFFLYGKRGFFNFKIPKNEIIEFNEQKDILNPYLIGYIFGDGNLDRVSITVKREKIRDKRIGTKPLKAALNHFYSLFSIHFYLLLFIASSDKQ